MAVNTRLLLRPDEVAQLLGTTPHTLATWRSTGKCPMNLPFIRMGRYVRYRFDVVLTAVAQLEMFEHNSQTKGEIVAMSDEMANRAFDKLGVDVGGLDELEGVPD